MKVFTLDELHELKCDRVVCVTCKYDEITGTPATHLCTDCDAPLCNSCGFVFRGKRYCNDCYEERSGVCSKCGKLLEPIYENNGYMVPNGPAKVEVSGYKICECRKEQS